MLIFGGVINPYIQQKLEEISLHCYLPSPQAPKISSFSWSVEAPGKGPNREEREMNLLWLFGGVKFEVLM